MDFKEFWDDYLNKDITTMSDTVIEMFNQEFPENIEKEYDLQELVLEFTGHHETSKKHDKIEEFEEVIKNKHPKIYEEVGGYINEALITYYCFRKEKEKLKSQLDDSLARDYDYDLVLESFKQLLYNNHIDLVNHLIEKEYDNVKNNKKLMGGAEYELAFTKFYIELERFFLDQKGNEPIDSSEFRKVVEAYDFEFEDNYAHIEAGLFKDASKTLPNIFALEKFPKNRTAAMLTLEMNFLKMMSQKNCPFPVSSTIWSKLYEYFEDKKSKNWQNYFSFKSASYREFLNRQGGFLSSNSKAVLILWGSSYFLDFLHQNQIIPDKNYTVQKKMIKNLKQELKEANKYELWEFNFIHAWEPDKNTEIEKWEAEKKQFEDSYELQVDPNEKSKFGFDKLFGKPFDNQFASVPKPRNIKPLDNQVASAPKPIRIKGEKRMGRNEKVTVKYKDGTIKEGVKYKKVMNDIDEGLCEIM